VYWGVYCELALVPRYVMANLVVTVVHIIIANMAICGRGPPALVNMTTRRWAESKKWKRQDLP
jgi:hypothetical protein